MKKQNSVSILLIIISVISLQSCTKIGAMLQYDIPVQSGSVTITIPPTSITSAGFSGAGSNSINIDSVIKANTAGLLGVNNITSVKLTSATMTLQNADANDNFANFKSVYASFTSNSDGSPYQISIANNPDAFASSISIPVDTTAELKNYISGSDFTYTAGGQLRTATTVSLICTINFTFNVHVQG